MLDTSQSKTLSDCNHHALLERVKVSLALLVAHLMRLPTIDDGTQLLVQILHPSLILNGTNLSHVQQVVAQLLRLLEGEIVEGTFEVKHLDVAVHVLNQVAVLLDTKSAGAPQ